MGFPHWDKVQFVEGNSLKEKKYSLAYLFFSGLVSQTLQMPMLSNAMGEFSRREANNVVSFWHLNKCFCCSIKIND